mgnify:CR=1 FL=1
MPDPDIIVADPSVDGAAGAAILARLRGRDYSVHFFASEELPDFFRRQFQEKLPRYYNLLICGLRVVRKDWQASPVRPDLMEALRGFDRPTTWFSTARWDPDDRAAVAATDVEALEREIDDAVYDLFALTDDEREGVEDYLDAF